MNKPKGGRGKRADYETEMVRVPVPIKDRVTELKTMFYENQLEFHDECIARDAKLAREYENLISSKEQESNSGQNLSSSLDEAIDKAKQILKQKKSAKESIAKLLSSLFNAEIKKEDLD